MSTITHLNVGCGTNLLPAPWYNTDVFPKQKGIDGVLDITKPLPFGDGTLEAVLAEHVIEHVTGPQAFRFMQECRRVLKPGGHLRICVPHLRDLFPEERVDIICNHGHLMVYSWSSLYFMLQAAQFHPISHTVRQPCDGHWKVIGLDKDDRETLRIVASVG